MKRTLIFTGLSMLLGFVACKPRPSQSMIKSANKDPWVQERIKELCASPNYSYPHCKVKENVKTVVGLAPIPGDNEHEFIIPSRIMQDIKMAVINADAARRAMALVEERGWQGLQIEYSLIELYTVEKLDIFDIKEMKLAGSDNIK